MSYLDINCIFYSLRYFISHYWIFIYICILKLLMYCCYQLIICHNRISVAQLAIHVDDYYYIHVPGTVYSSSSNFGPVRVGTVRP